MKLNYKQTFFIGLAFLYISAFWQFYDSIIPLILQKTFHFKETLTGVIMAMDNVLALFLLPLFGALSDKTVSRYGKRMPYIVVGTLVSIVALLLMVFANEQKSVGLFIFSLGIALLGMGVFRSPAVALMPDFTPKPLRSKANGVISLMGAIGGLFTLLAIHFLIPQQENPKYMPVFVAVALLMLVCLAILMVTVRENKMTPVHDVEEETKTGGKLPKDVKKSLVFILAAVFFCYMSFNALTSAYSRYVERVWHIQGGAFAGSLLVFTLVAIVSFIPVGIAAEKIGRKKTILCGLVILTLVYCLLFLLQNYSAAIYFIFALGGIGFAAFTVNMYPMVVDMSKSADVGRYTGYYYTFAMAAQIFTPILSGMFLEHISYKTLFPYAAFFSLLSLGAMIFVRHGDSKPKQKISLESFAADD